MGQLEREPELRFVEVKDGVQRLRDKQFAGKIYECMAGGQRIVQAQILDLVTLQQQVFWSDSVDDVLDMISEHFRAERKIHKVA